MLTLLMLIICTACNADSFFDRDDNGNKASEKMADYDKIYGLKENEGFVVLDMQEAADRAKKIDGRWFLSVNTVNQLNDKFYWNQKEEQLIVTTAESVDYYWPDAAKFTSNGAETPLERSEITIQNGVLYVSTDLIKKYTAVTFEAYEEPNRIVLWTDKDGVTTYSAIKKDTCVRTGASLSESILKKAAEGDKLYATGEEESGFIPVVTFDGFCGYVSSEDVKDGGTSSFASGFTPSEYTHNLRDGGYFTSVWHNVAYEAEGSLLASELDGSEGVDVVMPTWYRVIDIDGSISSLANHSYVDKAHELGLEVWGLVDDFAAGVPGIDVLSNTAARNNLSDSLVASAVEYGIDGINVDFEYITQESSPHYIQFLRELYLKMKPHGLKLSVDNYVPNSGNAYYNLKAQAEVADYIMLMTYDEHYSPETGVGSVASLNFVEDGVVSALASVPAERLVMGIPFFTRLWQTDSNAQVSMQVLTMKTEMDTVAQYGLEPKWIETNAQYYVSYVNKEGISCEMWLEEEESVTEKRRVCDNYGLAGTASWCLGYETDGIWDILK